MKFMNMANQSAGISQIYVPENKYGPKQFGLIFMFIIIAGIANYVLVVSRVKNSPNYLVESALYGALLGFFAYSTLQLPNMWSINRFPVHFGITDIIFGTVCSSLTSVITSILLNANVDLGTPRAP
jgi:uncharacterized membrane protein